MKKIGFLLLIIILCFLGWVGRIYQAKQIATASPDTPEGALYSWFARNNRAPTRTPKLAPSPPTTKTPVIEESFDSRSTRWRDELEQYMEECLLPYKDAMRGTQVMLAISFDPIPGNDDGYYIGIVLLPRKQTGAPTKEVLEASEVCLNNFMDIEDNGRMYNSQAGETGWAWLWFSKEMETYE
jgi:hypothetical protein